MGFRFHIASFFVLFSLGWFGFFVQWRINFPGLLNVKAIEVEEQLCYSIYRWVGDKNVLLFPKGISPKVNVIVLLYFQLAYYDVTVQHVSHNAKYTTPGSKCMEGVISIKKAWNRSQSGSGFVFCWFRFIVVLGDGFSLIF